MLNFTKDLNEFEPVTRPPVDLTAGIDFSKCFRRAGDVRERMKHGFKHGKKRGETTHVKKLDAHFRWKPGFLYCMTGWPQHGKTEMTQYLALLKAFFEGKKWAIHSPENYPEEEFFDTLAHTFAGMSTNPYHHNQMPEVKYDEAIDFIHEHFFYVYQDGAAHTPEFLREAYAYLHAEFGLFGTITDPWNKLAHVRRGLRDDEYLAEQLPQEQQQGRELGIVKVICAHPKSPGRLEKGAPLPIPDQYWLAGGQMWDNMCDVIACTYRPNYHTDKTDTLVELYTHKVKKQSLMGIPGKVEFNYSRHEARYYMEGACPLVPEVVGAPAFKPLPESTFEDEKAPF
jgi:hypothetical protein